MTSSGWFYPECHHAPLLSSQLISITVSDLGRRRGKEQGVAKRTGRRWREKGAGEWHAQWEKI